jgi:glyoxylase-like metal-dependent hydrolase (beta-lactamase superfamily II)
MQRIGQQTEIHIHASGELGIFSNAYLVETDLGVVVIDATLTVSESRALRAQVQALHKPLLAVLLTHAHPDHVAGLTELVGSSDVPIIALVSIAQLMQATEEPKRQQWGPVYKDEWVPRWTYPTQLVKDREALVFDGITYRAYDFGPGGDCDANSIWVMETDPRVAFVGDLVFNGMHSYMADDALLAWFVNLERAKILLADVPLIYPGHGQPGPLSLLDAQRAYLLAYCVAIQELAEGKPTLTEAAKQELTARMERFLPGAPLTFLIALSADAVAAELARRR